MHLRHSGMNPALSIIMPNYNCGRYLNHAIASVIGQTAADWELIIVDDCSTDRSRNIIAEWADRDSRVRYIFRRENAGVSASCNDGIREAAGKYLLFVASDDMLVQNAIEAVISAFDGTNAHVIVLNAEVVDCTGEKKGVLFSDLHREPPAESTDFFGELLKGNFIMTAAVKKEVIDKHGISFNEGFRHLNDWLFWLDLSSVCAFHRLSEPLYLYRIHEGNLSADRSGTLKEQVKALEFILDKYGRRLSRREKSTVFLHKCGISIALDDFTEARRCLKRTIVTAPVSKGGIKSFVCLPLTYLSPFRRHIGGLMRRNLRGPQNSLIKALREKCREQHPS